MALKKSGGPVVGLDIGSSFIKACEIEGVEALYSVLDQLPASGGELELAVLRGTEERTVTASFAAAKEAA